MGMQITRDMLTGWQSCNSSMQWFDANYPDGEGIEAGDGWAVLAGLRIKTTNWSLYAKVSAKSKPDNLFSGHWVDPASEHQEAA